MSETAKAVSMFVAQFFDKEHKNFLRDIARITDSNSGLSEDFGWLNFQPTSYTNSQNKKEPCYAYEVLDTYFLPQRHKQFH